ncbi:hypothetical protein [Nocardioides sp. SYSU DS0651]|uniref:hypothetical protein n=1 Tax=Nocardioides sp. SYSU DS0651 TaxID=3415955 RepID=UPI003F4B7659
MSDQTPPYPAKNPPPLTVAASLVAVQGIVLMLLAVLELANVTSGRLAMGLSTAAFFLAYGVVLLLAAWGLWQRRGWSRGPVLITQLILLGMAWTLREHLAVTLALVLVAGIVLAGMLNRDTIEALDADGQASDSSD